VTIFNVSQGGEHLVVDRTRHVWFHDDALQSGDPARIISTARAVNYKPYHPNATDVAKQFRDDPLLGRIPHLSCCRIQWRSRLG
jgi:hypothetical protein